MTRRKPNTYYTKYTIKRDTNRLRIVIKHSFVENNIYEPKVFLLSLSFQNLDDDYESMMQSPYGNWNTIHAEDPHYNDVIVGTIASDLRLFVQSQTQIKDQAQINENIKALRHYPIWGESTGDRWIRLTKGQ